MARRQPTTAPDTAPDVQQAAADFDAQHIVPRSQVAELKAQARAGGSLGAMSAQHLAAALGEETARRQVLTAFIKENLKEGTDYGKIANFGKPCLLKPGAEKFCSLLHLRATFKRDDETLSMLPQAARDAGAICLVCELHSEGGNVVSEGRGICTLAEKKGALNTALKIAQKRALMDATLRAFSISDSFTQDIDDPEQPLAMGGAGRQPAAWAARKPAPSTLAAVVQPDAATIERRRAERVELNARVKAAMNTLGWEKSDLDAYAGLVAAGCTAWEKLTLEQAQQALAGIEQEAAGEQAPADVAPGEPRE